MLPKLSVGKKIEGGEDEAGNAGARQWTARDVKQEADRLRFYVLVKKKKVFTSA